MAAMAAAPADGPRRAGCHFAPGAPDKGPSALLTFSGARWKIWSGNEAAVRVWHSDSAEVYTAGCFDEDGGRLVLGCASGRVQVWDAHGGELVGPVAEAFRALGRGADCAVSVVASTQRRRASVFAACGTMPDVLEVGMLDGTTRARVKAGKAGVCQLAASLSGAEWLLTAGGSAALKLWRVADLAGAAASPCAKFAPPGEQPTSLDLLSAGERALALCASGATQVSVFSSPAAGEGDSAGKAALQASVVLSCYERVQTAQFIRPDEDGAAARVKVIGFSATVAAIWSFSFEKATKTAAGKAIAPIFAVTSEEVGSRLLCARPLPGEAGAPALLLASGAMATPAFARARPFGGKGSEAIVQPLAGGSSAASAAAPADAKAKEKAGSLQQKPASTRQPTVLGPLEARAPKVRPQRPAVEAGEEEGSAQKRPRLPEVAPPPGGNVSLAPMARQGMRAKDAAAMEKVLQCANIPTIDRTVADLVGSEAFNLLQECTTRLLSAPIHGQRTCTWIQRVLLRHGAYISSQPVLRQALQPMQESLQLRVASQPDLSLLMAKLRVLRAFGSQIQLQKRTEKQTIGNPLLTYVEGDEDEEDEEDEGEAEQDADSDIGSDDIFDEDIFDDDDDDE